MRRIDGPRAANPTRGGLPENLDRQTNVDLRRRNLDPRSVVAVLLALLAAIRVAGSADLFGQEPRAATVVGEAADVTLVAPRAVRGGLIYQVTVRVAAHGELADPPSSSIRAGSRGLP